MYTFVSAALICSLVFSSCYLRMSRHRTTPLLVLSFVLACVAGLTAIAQFYTDSDIQLRMVLGLWSAIACLIAIGIDREFCLDAIVLVLRRLRRHDWELAGKMVATPIKVVCAIGRLSLFILAFEYFYMLYLILH